MSNSWSITRRGFLRRGAAAASVAVPVFVPGSALGKETKAAANERIPVGIIGTGRQTYIISLPEFFRLPDVQVVALCDVDRWRLEEGKKRVEKTYGQQNSNGQYSGCDTYTDYRELLGRGDIDAVLIATPDHWHTPMAIAAAESGKHVALEKPITRTIAEGQAIIEAMRKHKRVFRMDSDFRGPIRRHNHRMAELVRNGRLGKINAIRVGVPAHDNVGCPVTPPMPVPEELDYKMWQGPAAPVPYTVERVHPRHKFGRPGWMRVLSYCDGMITNWGTHLFDIAQWCFNTERTGPVEIEGHGVWPEPGRLWDVLKTFEVTYRYADGTTLYYENTRNPAITGAVVRCEAYVRFEGTDGWLCATEPRKYGLKGEPPSLLTSEIGPDEIHFPLKGDKRDFIDAIKTGGRTMEDEEVAHRTTSFCQLGHIAIHSGQKLRWDPGKEQFIDNDAAGAYLDKPILAPPETKT